MNLPVVGGVDDGGVVGAHQAGELGVALAHLDLREGAASEVELPDVLQVDPLVKLEG